jgi:hypothetical protein
MQEQRNRLEAIIRRVRHASEDEQRQAWEEIEQELRCPRCDWQGNKGRDEPGDVRLWPPYLEDWIAAAHCHFMHHAFWNRFPYLRRFAPKLTPAEWAFFYGPWEDLVGF